MKRNRALALALAVCLLGGTLAGCQNHEHIWAKATCTEPATCTICGKTEGKAPGHQLSVATCTEPATCTVCGKTQGKALGHVMSAATANAPATCRICGYTEGSSIPYAEANALPFTADRYYYVPMYAYLVSDGEHDADESELMRQRGYTVSAHDTVLYLCDATRSAPDADGNVTVTLPYVIKVDVRVEYDGVGPGGEFYTRWQFPTFGLFDYYSGYTAPFESADVGDLRTSSVDFDLDGRRVPVVCTQVSETRSNDVTDWIDLGDGRYETYYLAEYWYTLTAVMPADYDGLCLTIGKRGITQREDFDEANAELVSEPLLDSFDEGEGVNDYYYIRLGELIVEG